LNYWKRLCCVMIWRTINSNGGCHDDGYFSKLVYCIIIDFVATGSNEGRFSTNAPDYMPNCFIGVWLLSWETYDLLQWELDGFRKKYMSGKSTVNTIFILRHVQYTFLKAAVRYGTFTYLEKNFDQVLWEMEYWSIRNKRITKITRVIISMYEVAKTKSILVCLADV